MGVCERQFECLRLSRYVVYSHSHICFMEGLVVFVKNVYKFFGGEVVIGEVSRVIWFDIGCCRQLDSMDWPRRGWLPQPSRMFCTR